MSTVSNKSKVLVTGATGFLAVQICETLLLSGFLVRGTVRSYTKGLYLQNYFKEKGIFEDTFEFVLVEDITNENAFEKCVEGIDLIIHSASPFHYKAQVPDDLIKPAQEGTINLLKAASRDTCNAKRVVITSSIAAILEPTNEVKTFTENDWNTFSVNLIKEKGDYSPPAEMYRASKTLAEQAAWEYVADQSKFDLVTINPSFIMGPPKQLIPKPQDLNTSVSLFYNVISGNKTTMLDAPAGNIVDVRDVAKAHVLALTTKNAGGHRFLSNSDKGPFTFQDVVDVLHEKLPDNEYVKKKVPKGVTGSGYNAKQNSFTNSKAKEILDQEFIPFETTVIDTFIRLVELESQWL